MTYCHINVTYKYVNKNIKCKNVLLQLIYDKIKYRGKLVISI